MDGCLGTWDAHQWSNIHEEGLIATPGSISSFIFDPIQELQISQGTSSQKATSMVVPGAGILWGEGAPDPSSSLLIMNHHQQLPMISSPSSGLMGQVFGPNGTTSGSDTTNYSVEDDGISMIFSDYGNLLNFSRGESKNNPRKRNNNNIGFGPIHEMGPTSSPPKRSRKAKLGSSNISFQQGASSSGSSIEEPDAEAMKQMKEMIYRAAAFRPINIGPEAVVERSKRKNVRVSSDPQTVAARQRRERVSERLRVLQKMVPGGSKLDTASMLDEAANYLKFLRCQVKALQHNNNNNNNYELDHFHNYQPNHFPPPINLQFNSSSLPLIPMQKP